MTPQLEELWLRHAVTAFGRQMRLARFLGQHEWQWSARSGLLRLRREAEPQNVLELATQVLGSESQMSETWTWIWADKQAALGEELMRAAGRLRTLGEESGVPELRDGEFPLAQASGHVLALVACGVLGGAYYSAPFLGGAGFLLLEDERVPDAPSDAAWLVEVVRAAAASLPLRDQKRAVTEFLRQEPWRIEENDCEVRAQSGAQCVQARFDAAQRLIEIA